MDAFSSTFYKNVGICKKNCIIALMSSKFYLLSYQTDLGTKMTRNLAFVKKTVLSVQFYVGVHK